MTIADQTRIQAYQLRKGGTRARMAILRMIAADSANNANASTRLAPGDWKGARRYTLGDYAAAFGAGLWQGKSTWYTHDGEYFRDERNCDDVYKYITHQGWYGDTENGEKLHRGIVASLPHGRFLAGYEVADSEQRVYFAGVHDDEIDAARAADEHARIAAESEDEYSQKYTKAMTLEGEIENLITDLQACREQHSLLVAAGRGRDTRLAEHERACKIIADIRELRTERELLGVD